MPPRKKPRRTEKSNTKTNNNEILPLQCEWEVCGYVFQDMKAFSSHVLSHLDLVLKAGPDKRPFACEWRDCGNTLGEDFVELVRHVYFHAFHTRIKAIGSSVLKSCDLKGCILDPASRNMIPELPEKLACAWTYCEMSSENPYLFYAHVANHADTFPDGNNVAGGIKCEWEGCEWKGKSKHKLKEHLRSHTQEKLVACPNCGGLFSCRTKFLDHLRRQSEGDDQIYQCSHCNKRYSSERLLRDHMRHHVNHYKCPLCDMTCPNPSGLQKHIQFRHTEEKPFRCSFCDYSCKTHVDLRKHTDTHGVNQYECHIEGCEYSCKTYSSLSLHFRHKHQEQNSKEKYSCHLCNNSVFCRGTLLTKHLQKKHKFKWPSGHKRFRYKLHEDGIHRLQTVRYESIELMEQILTDEQAPGGSSAQTVQESIPEQESSNSQNVIQNSENTQNAENGQYMVIQPTDTSQENATENTANLSYNLEMLRDVALHMPSSQEANNTTTTTTQDLNRSHSEFDNPMSVQSSTSQITVDSVNPRLLIDINTMTSYSDIETESNFSNPSTIDTLHTTPYRGDVESETYSNHSNRSSVYDNPTEPRPLLSMPVDFSSFSTHCQPVSCHTPSSVDTEQSCSVDNSSYYPSPSDVGSSIMSPSQRTSSPVDLYSETGYAAGFTQKSTMEHDVARQQHEEINHDLDLQEDCLVDFKTRRHLRDLALSGGML